MLFEDVSDLLACVVCGIPRRTVEAMWDKIEGRLVAKAATNRNTRLAIDDLTRDGM